MADVLTKSEARSGDAVAMARMLVSTPSVNPVLESSGSGEREIAELTCGWLTEWGFDARAEEVAPGRWNAVGRLEGRGPGRTLILNGHLDTVGVDGMSIDPFGAELVDGRLLGRGSCDMKGGDASLLAAAAAVASTGLDSGTLIVALTADEEHASLGMQAFVDSRPRADAAVVCEPTSLAVMPAHKGFVWADFEFTGRAAHGSRPEVGRDSIEHAGLVLAGFPELRRRLREREAHPLLGHGSFHAGTIEGGVAPSVYPAECKLVVERRTLPGELPGEVMEEFEGLAAAARAVDPDVQVEVRQGLTRPPSDVSVESPLVRGLLEASSLEGIGSTPEGMTAWVDAAFLNEAGIPAVCFGPGSIEQAHSADEWIDVAEIETCARILDRFARAFLAG